MTERTELYKACKYQVEYFAADHGKAGGDEGFAGHLGFGILVEELVEDGIGDLVGHFVGMAFRDGLGCEKVTHFV